MCIFPFRKKFRKSLKPSNKKDELKQIEVIFPHSMMCNFICDKLKKIVNLQDFIKTEELHYKSKCRTVYT